MPCVDDFQYPCFSSSVQFLSSKHGSPHTSRPGVGTALSVLLILTCCWVCSSRLRLAVFFCLLLGILFCLLLGMFFCHLVQQSEILADLPLVVVQVLRLCAPFRQSGFASVVDFPPPLALLAVVLSLFSVFWRRLLQHYFVVVYCSEVPLKHLQRHYSVCATSRSLVRGRCPGSSAPQFAKTWSAVCEVCLHSVWWRREILCLCGSWVVSNTTV